MLCFLPVIRRLIVALGEHQFWAQVLGGATEGEGLGLRAAVFVERNVLRKPEVNHLR